MDWLLGCVGSHSKLKALNDLYTAEDAAVGLQEVIEPSNHEPQFETQSPSGINKVAFLQALSQQRWWPKAAERQLV